MTDIYCAQYGRYSCLHQREESIDDQLRKCRDFAEAKGWSILEKHIYSDKAVSGSSLVPREGLQKLMQVAESGSAPFQYVLVDDTSRVARNTQEALAIFSSLKFRGIHVYYVSQGIDTSQNTAETMITVHGLVDSLYSQELAFKVHRGMEGRVLNGFSAGSRKYGYRSVPVTTDKLDRYGNPEIVGYKLRIIPEEAEVVRSIYHHYTEDEWPATRIMAEFNKKLIETGFPKPINGRFWGTSTIYRILKNEIYRGRYVWNKTAARKNPATGRERRTKKDVDRWTTIVLRDLQIIDDVLWDKCKKRRDLIAQVTKGRYTKARPFYSRHLLTRIAKCQCGGTYSIVSGGKYLKYGCSVSWNTKSRICGNSIKIGKTLLENAVITTLRSELIDETSIDILHNEVQSNLSEYFTSVLRSHEGSDVEAEVRALDVRIGNMVKALQDGYRSEALKQELSAAEKRKADLTNSVILSSTSTGLAHIADLVTKQELQAYFSKIADSLSNPEETRKILGDIVKSITICRENDAQILIIMEENTEGIGAYLFDFLCKRDTRIRLQTGTGFIPYTSRVFKARIILSCDNNCNDQTDDEEHNVFFAMTRGGKYTGSWSEAKNGRAKNYVQNR